VTQLPADLINGFARAIADRFAESAKGLDSSSERFVRTRPAERILCGFLTPVGGTHDEEPSGADQGPPDLVADDKYEQTHIGFEWAVPLDAVGRGIRITVEAEANVFARVLPTFAEARENARFNYQGEARLAEVWQRFAMARGAQTVFRAEIDLDRAVEDGASFADLSDQSAAAWRNIGAAHPTLFPGRRDLGLRAANLIDEQAYRQWLASLQGPTRGQQLAWKPAIDVRVFPSPTEAGAVRLLLRLVNFSEPVDRRGASFVDPRLYAVALRASVPVEAHIPSEFRILPNSYRYDRRVEAIGINCQPRASRMQGEICISGETVPVTPTPRLVPREVTGGTPAFSVLADSQAGTHVLRAILESMERYDREDWAQRVNSLSRDEERKDAQQAREAFRMEIASFRAGVELLCADGAAPAASAFRLMNEAMLRAGRGRRRPITKWHLFQIVFIVSSLPGLVAASDESATRTESPLSILWFPAGGGKTEAFLGLIVWHAFFDRLTGKELGVTAFLRYPLRLLTYQQLQRVAWVLGQAEEIRLERQVPGHPFSLGYYVGESTTPNSISDTEHEKLRADGVPGNWQRIFRCPSCGQRSVNLRYNSDLRLIEHYCQSARCRTRGGRLPVFIVDDDLYRYLPTVIVSTVDKLALLGQNRRFAQFFGRFELYCSAHGAAYRGSNRKLCQASSEAAAGRIIHECGGVAVLRPPFIRPAPSLHVQDEMHLLRESLATFDSHYETAALKLQQTIDSSASGWALIGATATIEGYREQASHLYLRDAVRFPAPGPEAYESFYYTTDRELLGRLYIGVLGVGRTHTPSVARAIALLFGVVERARLDARRDLQAAQEYLGLPIASAEQVELLAFLYEIILTYVLTRKGGDQVSEAVDTRVRRDIEELAGGNLRIETFNSNVDMPHMISTMEEIEAGTQQTPIGERVRGVVATNIISHGVDVDRFNVMVFAGLPRQFAEYIQASARVGRQVPGISVLIVTPQAERDRSVFDRFDKFHQYVDRLVEPVPVNRWSEPALELTLRGILAAYLMGAAPTTLGREIYLVDHVKELFGRIGAEALEERRVIQWITDAVGGNCPQAPPRFREVVERLAGRYYGQVTGAAHDRNRDTLNSFLDAMRSLRDVDDPAWIRVGSQADVDVLAQLGM